MATITAVATFPLNLNLRIAITRNLRGCKTSYNEIFYVNKTLKYIIYKIKKIILNDVVNKTRNALPLRSVICDSDQLC